VFFSVGGTVEGVGIARSDRYAQARSTETSDSSVTSSFIDQADLSSALLEPLEQLTFESLQTLFYKGPSHSILSSPPSNEPLKMTFCRTSNLSVKAHVVQYLSRQAQELSLKQPYKTTIGFGKTARCIKWSTNPFSVSLASLLILTFLNRFNTSRRPISPGGIRIYRAFQRTIGNPQISSSPNEFSHSHRLSTN